MVKLKFPTTREEFAAERERITGKQTPKEGLNIYASLVPALNSLYESEIKGDLDSLRKFLDVLDRVRKREEMSPTHKRLIDVFASWAAEAYIQGRRKSNAKI